MFKTVYDIARERELDKTLPSQPFNRRREAYKAAGDGLTYPCCPYCGKRLGEDNSEKKRGEMCDLACLIAWKMRFDGRDMSEDEARAKRALEDLRTELMLEVEEEEAESV